MDAGLFVVRAVTGLIMAAHGAQKLFGWFGGHGLTATGRLFEQIGFRPGPRFAAAAGIAELFGGLLIALGFLGPIGPALVLATMIVAGVSVHWPKGLFAQNGGYELALIYAVVAIAIALTGPGAYSIDGATGLASLWTAAIVGFALAAGVGGGVVVLVARRPAPVGV